MPDAINHKAMTMTRRRPMFSAMTPAESTAADIARMKMDWIHCRPAVPVPVSAAIVVKETETKLMGSWATKTARVASQTAFFPSGVIGCGTSFMPVNQPFFKLLRLTEPSQAPTNFVTSDS